LFGLEGFPVLWLGKGFNELAMGPHDEVIEVHGGNFGLQLGGDRLSDFGVAPFGSAQRARFWRRI
jgi:hypothetical protein